MTEEKLKEKMDKSGMDCRTCEFRVVPIRIEPCKSCGECRNYEKERRAR